MCATKIKKLKVLIYALLIFAILNATLRITNNGMTSFFRIISPFPAIILCICYFKKIKKTLLFLAFIILYSLLVSLAYYNNIYTDYYVFFGYLIVLFILIKTLNINSINFSHTFFVFLDMLTTVSIILCIIQFFVRIPYPFLNLPAKKGVNIFMSNENEIAEPLGCMFLLYFYRFLFLRKKHFLKMIAILTIILINDSKLTLFGCIIGFFLLLLFWVAIKLSGKKTLAFKNRLLIIFGLCVSIFICLCLINPTLSFRDYDISFNELILAPISHILSLTPLPGAGGSEVDRTNAIIFGLKEFKNSNFLGIGLGNSVEMLAKPEYHLLTAQSMHNLFFQLICEFGILSIFLYAYMLFWLVTRIKYAVYNPIIIFKISFFVAFILISSQSSIGILSNYFTWIIVFYVVLLPTKRIRAKQFENVKKKNCYAYVVK